MSEFTMTSNQPYLLKAFFDWIVDNELTPHLVVDATQNDVSVPQQYVNDGQIVLNVAPSACMNFNMTLEGVSFQARFGGQPHYLYIPSQAVLAIYARENGAGTVFTVEPDISVSDSDIDEEVTALTEELLDELSTVEATSETNQEARVSESEKSSSAPSLGIVSSTSADNLQSAEAASASKTKKKPTFTVVK